MELQWAEEDAAENVEQGLPPSEPEAEAPQPA
eukprot:COSAG06_NODE_16132_length_1020_cov_1.438654_2_plen_31_part_01